MRQIFSLVGRIRTEGLDALNKGLQQADKQLTKTARDFDKMGRNLGKIGAGMTKLTVPLLAFGAAAYKGVQAASDLAETVSKVGQIFGDSADEVLKWSETSAETLGQSKQQALDAASTFALFGKAAGLTGQGLVKFSTDFTALASDLASFNNTTPEAAITAIGAALRGESEPIRKYGVLLDDATMRQKALAMGITETTKNALTPQQKTLAAAALIFEKTKTAQGDFIRTSDGLANQSRVLKAEVANLTAEFGKAFLPIAVQVVGLVRDNLLPAVRGLVDWWSNLSTGTQKLVTILGTVLAVSGPLLIALGGVLSSVKTLTTTFALLNKVMLANPYVAVAAAVAALGVALYVVAKNTKSLNGQLDEMNDKRMVDTKAHVEELTFLYGKLLANANRPMPVEEFDKLNAKIKELETNVNDAGVALEGSISQKLEQAENYLTDMTETTSKASEATKDFSVDLSGLDAALLKTGGAADKATESIDEFEKGAQMALAENAAKEEELAKKREETLIANNASMLEANKAAQDAKIAYYEETAAKERKIAEDTAAHETQQRQDATSIAIDSINTIFSLFAQATDNKIQRIDQATERERKAIEQSTMGEEQKRAKISALEDAADMKKRKLLRDQAKRDKAAAIFGAIINTAQGVSKALTLAFPLNIIMAAVTGALGIAQIAIIASQPLPALAEGGLVKQSPGGVQAIIGEGNQDELILPMRTGVKDIARGVIDGLVGAVLPPAATPALAFGGGGSAPASGPSGGLHLHIGTLIADEWGLKNLERTLLKIRVSEDQRKGAA